MLSMLIVVSGLSVGRQDLRRRNLIAGAAISGAVLSSTAPRFASASASTALSREDTVNAVLSRVPAYLVINKDGRPYLTEMDASGRRSGYVFLGPRDAAPVLREVQRFDPAATLAVMPLSTVYLDVARNTADAERLRAIVPQPKGSTSSDMRLFQLQPLNDESESLNAVSMVPGATMAGVTLFYEPNLFLGTPDDPTSRARPYFFRLKDLNMVWRKGGGDERNAGQVSPSLRMVSLEALLRQLEAGDTDLQPMLMPPSETAELQYRR